ncbi:MAG: membrane protein insertase YidC [Holophagae bacterium]|nr:membrane protein insertase YidC [Holophagae bacterium]
MEKRTVLAIVISIVFILIWQKMVVDKVSPQKTTQNTVVTEQKNSREITPASEQIREAADQAIEESDQKTENQVTDNEVISDNTGARITEDFPEEEVTLENQYVKLRFTNKGGRLLSAQIKGYKDENGAVMELVNPVMAERGLTPFSTEGKLEYLNNVGFKVVRDQSGVTFSYGTGNKKVEKNFHLLEAYQLKVSVTGYGLGEIELSLGPGIDSAERMDSRYSTEDTVVFYTEDSVERIKKKKLNHGVLSETKLDWVAIEDKYFAKIFKPETRDLKIIGGKQSYRLEKKDIEVSDILLVGNSIEGTLFLGPKDYDVMKTLGNHYEEIVNFGFFGIFAKWLFFALRWINGWIHNYGWSIILLTILIRLLIFPISQSGLKSMKDMQRVQPKMKEIQAKYKKYGKDLTKKQEMNREIQDLYKKEGVSPLGGCLPMVLQMPIFFAFWSLLLNVIELRQAPFMFWIKDLSAFDPYYVLPVLMGVSQLISQIITPSTGDANQKKMMYALPIVFTVVLATAPSGLIVYWTTNNLFQIVQQMLVNRSMKEAVGE